MENIRYLLDENTDISVTPFNQPLNEACLNVTHKTRTNLFAWRGQFTPQLVESLLSTYTTPNSTILDPFAGSGTVLLEAGRLGFSALGAEINPAAVLLAKTYELINLKQNVRRSIIESAEATLSKYVPDPLPLFNGNQNTILTKERYTEIVNVVAIPEVKLLLETFGIIIDFAREKADTSSLWTIWERFKSLIKNLPESDKPIQVNLGDARALSCTDNSIDFVLTSPPYINVFNYHQYYRASAEILGWQPLNAARSEIGSNRKFRQNRFLTVIQYCLDMSATLYELQRVCHAQARIIFVVGRESNVRKTPFFNSEIISRLATDALRFKQDLRQERVFSNKFGQAIYEDILHLTLSNHDSGLPDIMPIVRSIAKDVLEDARQRVPTEAHLDLENAIEQVKQIEMSPLFQSDVVGPEKILHSYAKNL